MLLTTAILLTCALHWCAYNFIARSINQDTIPLSLLGDLELGILWIIPVVSYAALLYRQQMLHRDANSKLSPDQTLEVSNRTKQFLTNLESLVAEQTTKLEDATNRFQAELTKRLQSKESLLCLSKVVEEASDAICITDADGFPTDINKAFLQLFGYPIDELNAAGGLLTLFVIHAVAEEIHSLILNGYVWKGEVEIRARNSEIIQAELHAEAIENQTSQIISIVFILTNVTKQKQVEAALQQSEERLMSALRAAHLATWEWDLKTRKIVWSDNLETVFGFNPETFSGDFKSLLEYIHPDDHQKLNFTIGYAVDEHVDYKIEFRSLWLDGSFHWLEAKGQILYDKTSQTVRMLGTVLDITERKKAEDLLTESEATKRAFLEAIPDMLFRISRKGFYLGFISTNNLQLPPTTYLLDKHLSEVLPAEVTQLAMDKIEQALNMNTIQTAEYQLLMNGDWHQYKACIVPVKTDEVLAIIRDISDDKRAEEELPKSEVQFQELISVAWRKGRNSVVNFETKH